MPDIMVRANRPSSFDLRGVGHASAEEVSVGAYARRQFRRRVLLGVFGAALIIGAIMLYEVRRPPTLGEPGDRYPVRVRCASCGYTATLRVPFDQTFPMRCPKCGQVACQELWQCRECGHQFVPEQTGTILRCPECGSERVGSAATP
jgi:predicted Zn-ribbon and HTH transcriptional regulator